VNVGAIANRRKTWWRELIKVHYSAKK